jgi:hypothetical protein
MLSSSVSNLKQWRTFNQPFYRTNFDFFEVITTYDKIKVIGNTGIACGRFTDKRKPIGGDLETIQGRQSVTFLKLMVSGK